MKKPALTFQDLMVWQKTHEFVFLICKFTKLFSKKEIYILTSQLRRSSISIPANIVEGFKKKGKADKVCYLNIAKGSLVETRYYLILAHDLGYGNFKNPQLFLEEVSKLLEIYSSSILNS